MKKKSATAKPSSKGQLMNKASFEQLLKKAAQPVKKPGSKES